MIEFYSGSVKYTAKLINKEETGKYKCVWVHDAASIDGFYCEIYENSRGEMFAVKKMFKLKN